jgi:hypothetical protein
MCLVEGSWKLGRYKEIERVISCLIRTITHNMRSFPADLLYMSTKDGGLGFPSFVDRVQKEKWAMVKWCEKLGGSAEAAVQSLMERPVRQACRATKNGIK